MEKADIIEKEWPENYGRAWVELLESDLSEHARICYVAMTSFGKEARAGKKAIMRRMGVKSLTTVKAAQDELANKGWMRLKQAGTATTPNHWQMFSTAKKEGGVGHTAPQGGPLSALPLGRVVTPKQEDKQEDKQETLPQAVLPTKIAIAAFCEYRKQVGRYPSYSCTGKDAGAVKALLKNNPELTVDEWRAGFAAFYKEDPTFTGQHSLSCYANTFNKYKTITPKKRWDQL